MNEELRRILKGVETIQKVRDEYLELYLTQAAEYESLLDTTRKLYEDNKTLSQEKIKLMETINLLREAIIHGVGKR